MKFLNEFKDFALRGNLADIAVAFVMFMIVKAMNNKMKKKTAPATP